ncbi:hypothetical protein CI102_4317 [Trichoderma harzianum]|uniref:Aflatoxin regulatory protein domain-containing protein n=1 Tax=Trichoderma harzianum CBS 226.95 TaxID=983964 RepID=A0A2T4ASX4_TRIHA|nr:hypothetical protein M431DRAFT_265 [Trichoderma harzianum CBS 226.95]PKK50209.1 hypothetical protein CI102_4317 [Trichoderma harzianum]PTB60165.1 hypothetical protein M431DRAFT_265 [Trichoderma harzianum CBS 226.95]
MSDQRSTEIIGTSVTSSSGHTITNMTVNCKGCFESAHLSQNFMLSRPFNDDMAVVDHSGVFSAFEEGCGNMPASLRDPGSEMDRLGFFPPPTVPELYQPPSPCCDTAPFLVSTEDTTGFDISESISIPEDSSCSCCSSIGRSEISSARFSSIGPSTASPADMSTGGTSPADIPKILACQCLNQALQLLKKVSGSLWASSTAPGREELWTRVSSIETQSQCIQAMLSENRQCLGAIDNILACPSTDKDSMLPGILCMVLLKILDRYSNMAWSRPRLSHRRSRDTAEVGSNMSGYLIMETGLMTSTLHLDTFISNEQGQTQHIHLDRGASQLSDDEEFGRAISHLVLGELHWAQRLVDKLMARLKCVDCYNASRPTQQSCRWENRQQTIPLPMEEHADPGLTSSFSAGTLEHMATDIQKRLTTLSSVILNQLRQS